MKKEDKSAVIPYLDKRLIRRLRIYTIVMLIMLLVIIFEILQGTFTLAWAVGGMLIGLGIGTLVSRMYSLNWDEDTSQVISRIDWIGGVILVCYLTFVFTRTHYLSYWIQGAPLMGLIFSLTAGTMLGRVLTTEHGIKKILKTWDILGINKKSDTNKE
jgi:peptidoglycan/LPS O-acetylase OafA/YrhL